MHTSVTQTADAMHHFRGHVHRAAGADAGGRPQRSGGVRLPQALHRHWHRPA
jgi:hypothetical protein